MKRLLTLILVLFLAAACQPDLVYPTGDKAKSVDRSLITGHPCEPPCLYGLVPGQTTYEETLKILVDIPQIRNVQEFKRDNRIEWQSTLTDWGYGMLFFNTDGKIASIRYSPEYPLHLQDLIAARGDPGGIAVSHAPCAECTELCYEVIWPKIGVWFRFCSTYDDFQVAPKPDDLIDTVYYSAPSLYSAEYLQKNRYCPWAGYKPPLAKGRNMQGTPDEDAYGCSTQWAVP